MNVNNLKKALDLVNILKLAGESDEAIKKALEVLKASTQLAR